MPLTYIFFDDGRPKPVDIKSLSRVSIAVKMTRSKQFHKYAVIDPSIEEDKKK